MPSFLSNVDTGDLVLAPATPVTVNLAVDGARDWTFTLRNVGLTNPLTAATIAYGARGADDLTDAEAFPAGIPLAAGAAVPIVGTSRPVVLVRLVLTSTLGTTVRVRGGGW